MLGYLIAWAIGREVVGTLEEIENNQRRQIQMQQRRQRELEGENIFIKQNITNNVQINQTFMGMTQEEYEKEMEAFQEFRRASRNAKKK